MPNDDVQTDDTGLPLVAGLHIIDWRACGCTLRGGDVGFTEAHHGGWIDSGNLANLLRLATANAATLDQTIFGNALACSVLHLRYLLRRNSRRGSRRNIHLHYDLGNGFYRLQLDEGMAYSSACFNGNPRHGFAEAQVAKYRRARDMLRVEPGMDMLEIGCGWGGLMEMTCTRGAYVHGITLPEEQHRYAAERLAGEPRAYVELRDYRDLDGAYDAIASIEMFEVVGEAYWPNYFRTLMCCLRHEGRALVQSITIDEAHFKRYRVDADFTQQSIFPGGMLFSHEHFIKLTEQHGSCVADRLDFGRDYAEILRRRSQHLETRLDAVRVFGFDDSLICIRRLYSAYCETGFDGSRIGVSQFLLKRG